MSTLTSAPTVTRSDLTQVLVVPVLAGIVLGVGDVLAITHVAYPWANLANSSAVWAIAAFVLGAVLRTDPVRAAVAGAVLLVVAVEAYYGYATLTDLAGYHAMWSPTSQTWLVFGVFAGVIFGVAGAWTREAVWWRRVVGSATGAAVLLGEALHTLLHLDGRYGDYRAELVQTAIAMAVLGAAALVLSARSASVLAVATVTAVPAALFSAAAFAAIGIAY
jgi:hypothetical protein